MAKHKYDSKNQPAPEKRKPRGKDKRTLILDALSRAGVSEEGFYDRLVIEALGVSGEDGDGKANQVAFIELWKRFHPIPKPVAPAIVFDYPAGGTLADRARAIELGIAEGIIPPDIGVSLLAALGHVAKAEEVTEVLERIARIEEALNAKSAE